MKKIRSLDLKYAGSQIFYFAAICSMMGFASVYLLDKNFNNSTIGIVLSLCNILAVVFQPILASFVDNHKNIELKQVISIIVLAVIALSSILYILPISGMFLLILIVAIFSMMSTIMPLMNSLAFIFEKYGIEINYGLARGLGSVAYAFTSMLLGYVVESFSPGILPLFYVIFSILLFIVVRVFVLPKTGHYEMINTQDHQKEETQQLSLTKFCAKYKKFILFLLGFVFVYFAHTIINNFFIQVINDIGGTSSDMGNAIFLAAMLELPTMAYFTKLSEKVNCEKLIKLSIMMFFIKHTLTYFATSMLMIYIAQAIQMFAYALFVPASVYYVNEKIAVADRVKGQSMVTMSMTLSGVFASFLGGILIDSIGVHQVLFVGAIASAIGAIIVYFTVEKI